MTIITLYPQQNKVHVTDGAGEVVGVHSEINGITHQFTRRWEGQILSMLLLEGQAGRALTSASLQQTLRRKGQPKDLNRAQLQRLFDSLNEFLIQLPGQPLNLQTAPRQATVGPWKLEFTAPVTFHDAEIRSPSHAKLSSWTYPGLLVLNKSNDAEQTVTCVDTLLQLLSVLLTSDSFAVNGDYVEAIDSLQPVYKLSLTSEASCLFLLREALWHKRLGHFDTARQLTQKVLANPPELDLGQANNAKFFLHRIDYDESPAQAHSTLWHSATPPGLTLQADWRGLSEWHNLRALLARRRLLDLPQTVLKMKVHQVPRTQSLPETTVSLHQTALNHLQSAIYWALQQRDWDRLQAYVSNTAFHLQSVVSLGFVTVSQVFNWHRLCLNYGDKLYSALDSGWEFIFLGEFWLNHHAELTQSGLNDPLAHTIDSSHPSQHSFYINALDKLKKCADVRQLAIMWVLYGRFAADHLSAQDPAGNDLVAEITAVQTIQKIQTIQMIEEALSGLLHQHPNLRQTLQEEGYAANLPAA